jgi:transcriptional regulator with XRE-family HTH domain
MIFNRYKLIGDVMRKIKSKNDLDNLKMLSKFLMEKKKKDKLRFIKLAKESGMARCSVSKIVNGTQDVNFTTLLKLLNAMSIEITFKEKLK